MSDGHEPPITHGDVTRCVSIQEFKFTYTNHGASQVVPPHAHGNASITIPLRGDFLEIVERRPIECGPGAILLKAAGAVHENRYSSNGARSLILEIPSTVLAELGSANLVRSHCAAVVRQGLPWASALRLHRCIASGAEPTAVEAQELIIEILGFGSELTEPTATRPPKWLRRVRDRLEDGPPATPSLAGLAAEVGVHPVYLARIFRRYYQCSVGDYVRRCRVERALTALTRTSEPLARMAARLGFHDQPHFTRQFRRASGFTPAAFRCAVERAAIRD